jgi:ribosomal protein S12 methylthiotransferase accessory factor
MIGAGTAIRFRGNSFRSAKGFRDGTHRTQDPTRTLELIRPYLARAGVTRLADITGLDNIGVPTTLAIRPNAETMACSSGKGLTLEQAYVSGAMEAFELYAAETVELSPIRGSYQELSQRYSMPRVEHLPLTENSLFTTSWPHYWCQGWDLLTQSEIPIPMALVGMSSGSMRHSLRAFLASSNGLGAGNSLLEAICAGLYEVLERDGVACHYYAALRRGQFIPIVPSEILIKYPSVSSLLEKCAKASVKVVVQECVVDTAVPIYNAFVYDTIDRGVPVTRGSGCHLDPEIALIRAITEALQGRLNYIAGSRDDIFRAAFSRSRSGWATSVSTLERGSDLCPRAVQLQSGASDSFEEDIQTLLSSVKHVGLPHAVVFDLTPKEFPIYVVRVVVPGLEGYMHHGYHPGVRASSFAVPGAAP